MAQYNDEIILNITTNYGTAVNEIVRLTKELGKLKADMDGVRAAQKNKEITDDEANKKLEALNAEYRKLNASVRSYRKEIDTNLQKEEANTGSLKEMRAQLKLLIKQYDELSQTDREAIGGVGEQKLLEIRHLQEELKNAEEASGRFQRSVGSYEDAIRRALDGTIPMKQAVRELKTEIQTLTFQYSQQGNEINKREQDLIQLGNAVGVDTEEYRQQAAELERLKQDYETTGQALTQMSQAAGQMDDAMKDASQSIANFGKDNANLKAMTQGAQLLLNGYTALKAGLTALGIESEELYNVFSKIQILQQGLNAVTQIANMLEKQSILSQQAKLLWTKLTTSSILTLTAAKKKDTKATAEEAAANAVLTTSEVAATTAAGGLTVALKAVGKAILSLPLIGWLVGAVALVGTVVGLIAKANKEEKKSVELKKADEEYTNGVREAQKKATEEVVKSRVQLEANVRMLGKCEKGTAEWKKLVGEVASQLGVTEQWLQRNLDKVDELIKAWVTMAKTQAMAQAYVEQLTQLQLKLNTMDYNALTQIMDSVGDDDKTKWAAALVKELGIAKETAQAIADAYKVVTNGKGPAANRAKRQIEMFVDFVKEQLKGQIDDTNAEIDKIYGKLVEDQKSYGDLVGDGIAGAGKNATDTADKTADEIGKKAKELSEELENLMVEGMADGLEKNIKQVEQAAERYIEKMKEARDKDAENKEKYDAIILQYEKNTQDKIRKMRAEGYQTIIANAEKLTESYNQLWASYAPNSFYNFVNDLADTANKVSKEVNRINKEIRDLENQVDQYRKTQGAESIFAADQEALSNQLKEQLKDLKEPIPLPVKPELVLDDDAVITQWRKIIEKLSGVVSVANAKELADAWEKELKGISRQLVNGTNVLDIKGTIDSYLNGIAGKTTEGVEKLRNVLQEAFNAILNDNGGLAELQSKLDQYAADLEKYNKRKAENNKIQKENASIQDQIAEADSAAAKARENEAVATENLNTAQEKLAEANKNYLSNLDESILKNRALNKSLREYAKTIQQVLLEQAKLGNINIIPQDFSVYIDYQIDKLEEELAKAYRELERMAPKVDFSTDNQGKKEYTQQRNEYNRILGQLNALKEARKAVSEDLVKSGATGGFFDNAELLENEMNIKRVSNQIRVLEQVISQGNEAESKISGYEEENNYLYKQRITLLHQIGEAVTEQAKAEKEAELEKVDGQIASNNEAVNQLKQTLALMGYTSEEEMQQLLESLKKQEKAFSDQTDVIMKKTAASVVQSIGTIANSLLDLMNAIGDDNAEMANFLEGVAYMQIGVNMAVGVSEAIAAGSGVPFPGNLAAIAAGVAAVVSGIASAISTYKQYHKQVSSPRFAEGGYVSGEKGVDKIPAWLSDGEYVIKRKRVKELGVPFLDALNQGKSVVGRTHFAEGGYVNSNITNIVMNEEMKSMMVEAMSEIQPIVSVREISNVQNRVRAKESIARK